MWLSITLFPDLDGLDGLISESETVLSTFLWVLAILIAFVVVGNCIERIRRRVRISKVTQRRLGIVRRRPF